MGLRAGEIAAGRVRPDSRLERDVKASVPGTRQAQEATIANAIPQTATVEQRGTTMDPAPTIDGDPEYRAIEGTTLRYVLNASTPSPAGGWEQHGGAAWRPVAPAPALDREFQARSMGEGRSRGFSRHAA